MARFIHIKNLFDHIGKKRVRKWIDRVRFSHILLIWLTIVVLFGCTYFYLQSADSYLLYIAKLSHVTELKDAIYFSFITATTTGFGDIVPYGILKTVAVFEVVLGMLLLALVTSKLVSIKQDVILDELYESSIYEKLNRFRSSFLLFRQNLNNMMSKIEEGSIKRRGIENIYMQISMFEDSLNQTLNLLTRSGKNEFGKGIDRVNIELVFISIINSFETLQELITMMNQNKLDWKKDINLKIISSCMAINNKLFENLSFSKNLLKDTVKDLAERKNIVIAKIEAEIAQKHNGGKEDIIKL